MPPLLRQEGAMEPWITPIMDRKIIDLNGRMKQTGRTHIGNSRRHPSPPVSAEDGQWKSGTQFMDPCNGFAIRRLATGGGDSSAVMGLVPMTPEMWLELPSNTGANG